MVLFLGQICPRQLRILEGGEVDWVASHPPFGEAKITKIAKFGARRRITYNILTDSLVADCISHPPLKNPASAPARRKGVMKLTLCEAPTREKRQTKIQKLRALHFSISVWVL